jgi:hypothetical protein
MYRLALLVCFCLFLAVTALAQQPVSSSTSNSQMSAGVTQELMKAPEPGHPLDPNDVAVLTGKDKEPQSGAYGDGSTYLMYGTGTGNGSGSGSGYGYGRGSAVPLLSGDILPLSGDVNRARAFFFGFVPRRIGTPFARRSLAGSIRHFPTFGTHRPAFGFRF